MKPGWHSAPEWARWLSMDYDGEWSWFDREPAMKEGVWQIRGGQVQYAGRSPPQSFKEERPHRGEQS